MTKRVKKYDKMITHQIPSHLAFCTLGQNKKKMKGKKRGNEKLRREEGEKEEMRGKE